MQSCSNCWVELRRGMEERLLAGELGCSYTPPSSIPIAIMMTKWLPHPDDNVDDNDAPDAQASVCSHCGGVECRIDVKLLQVVHYPRPHGHNVHVHAGNVLVAAPDAPRHDAGLVVGVFPSGHKARKSRPAIARANVYTHLPAGAQERTVQLVLRTEPRRTQRRLALARRNDRQVNALQNLLVDFLVEPFLAPAARGALRARVRPQTRRRQTYRLHVIRRLKRLLQYQQGHIEVMVLVVPFVHKHLLHFGGLMRHHFVLGFGVPFTCTHH
uniref:Uncharacterized protein n=1 Tax=Anopheles atroparvus TaxID=41427 RepID=A0A182J654_ANOAO